MQNRRYSSAFESFAPKCSGMAFIDLKKAPVSPGFLSIAILKYDAICAVIASENVRIAFDVSHPHSVRWRES